MDIDLFSMRWSWRKNVSGMSSLSLYIYVCNVFAIVTGITGCHGWWWVYLQLVVVDERSIVVQYQIYEYNYSTADEVATIQWCALITAVPTGIAQKKRHARLRCNRYSWADLLQGGAHFGTISTHFFYRGVLWESWESPHLPTTVRRPSVYRNVSRMPACSILVPSSAAMAKQLRITYSTVL